MVNLHLATYNVRGLGNDKKRREVFHYLNIKPYDIIYLQETHSSEAIERRWRLEWGGTIVFSHGSTNVRGVAILIKKKCGVKVKKAKIDSDGRMVMVSVKINWKLHTCQYLCPKC